MIERKSYRTLREPGHIACHNIQSKLETSNIAKFSLYNISRIPLPNSDAFSSPAPTALHATVMIDNFIYSVDVFSPPGNDGVADPLEVGVICSNIKSAVSDAKKRRASGDQAPRVGLLTADERDSWTKVSQP